MANLLIIRVDDIALSSTDTLSVDFTLASQESGTVYSIGGATRTISMKTLGIYNTATQLNLKIRDEALDYAADNSHDLDWDHIWLCGKEFALLNLL